ncbi:bromodomain adjacent to zinc finger domain protein 2B-like isoform X1 [Limulus polyphemus]|uniref:Bromodomain adjacent to zinc finger domain protein 2B-like isoform X1 n=1 Tax=Limulus polyphemus TaxID=6850 RepID=A0ABM1RW44_LIMPO|nr:bromodomain adjacent to zinc finger domain protein 2B-like isoform X1 [Limulus polyphemus]XP_022235599.1 bromodomain adjacent to zinc finger domain protein 2B-like isoform X1 [Limulus polyphemus]XP_022235601.1 bromodomain adjacent to zinc finger domain protein 2B-like isoform X1 [Limulus polyphemus]
MLGHLYAKPPSAEVYLESRVADVNGPASDNHSSKTLINTSLPTLEDKSELFKENGDLSNSSTSLSDKTLQEAASPLPEQTLMEKENKTDFRVISKSPIETEDKTPSPAQPLETWKSSSNGIQKLVITKTKGKYRKKQPEGAPPEETSSDNESQSDDSNDSSNDSGNSSSSDSASGSTTSDSGDVTTHPPQRNNSSEHQETQLYLGKHMDESPNDEPPSDEDEDLEPLDLKARPDFPSPAHDVSTSLCLTSETCPEQDSDSMPTPLDLCIKKHEDSAMTLQTEEIFCTDNSCIPLSSTAPLLVSSTASSKPSPSGAQKHRRKPKIAEDIERKQKSELKQKRNAQVKHQQRLTQKLQALQQKEFAETKVIPQFPVTSFPSDLIICPVPTKTQVKRGKHAETANNTTFTVVTTNNKASLQSTGKGSQSVTLNVEKLMSYMLPQSSPSRGRGRGRPRGRGRGRGRPSVDSSSQRREKSPRRQTQRNISSENLSVDEPTSDSKSSSECEASDVCDDDDIDDEDEKSATAKIASSGLTSTSGRGTKRHNYGSEVGSSPKKKRILPDETEIRIPLEHGWRRQTKIRCFSRSGVRGEVVYFAPCGKKLRNYPEVVRYLQRHGITD